MNLGRGELKYTQDRGKILEENGDKKDKIYASWKKKYSLWSSSRSSSKSFKLYNYLLFKFYELQIKL